MQKLLFVTLFLSIQYGFSQVKIDTFKIPINQEGNIIGKHFYSDDAGGKLVLFSGTFNSDQSKYECIANKLASNGFHVITYDQRGHGISSAQLTTSELRGGKLPIHDQETHNAIEKYHPIDLEAVYQYSMDLAGINKTQTVICLESGILGWSFKMVNKHPEIRNFILLTSYFGDEGEKHFSQYSGFNILTVLSESNPRYAQWTKSFFSQNKGHNVHEISCLDGWGYLVTEKCPLIEDQIIDWIKDI